MALHLLSRFVGVLGRSWERGEQLWSLGRVQSDLVRSLLSLEPLFSFLFLLKLALFELLNFSLLNFLVGGCELRFELKVDMLADCLYEDSL